MSGAAERVARRTGYAMLWPLVIGLPVALFVGGIDVPVFLSVGALWLCIAVFLIIGPDSISEISFGKASIKRDVAAAREIKEEVEAIRNQLRSVAKAVVEDSWILASTGALAMGGDRLARERLESNLELLSTFVENDPVQSDRWWSELFDLFPNRKKEKST